VTETTVTRLPLLALITITLQDPTGSTPQNGTSSIAGSVFRAGTNEPIARTRITVTRPGVSSGPTAPVAIVLGEPIASITVQLVRSVYDGTGERTLTPIASAVTNDRGDTVYTGSRLGAITLELRQN
jgi:hypothetical protein